MRSDARLQSPSHDCSYSRSGLDTSSEQRRHHSDPASCVSAIERAVIQLLQYNSLSNRLFSAYTDDTLCDVIGCYGYDVNSAAAAAEKGEGAKDKRAARGRDMIPIPIPMPTSRFSIFTCYLSSCTYCVCMEIQVFNLFHAS